MAEDDEKRSPLRALVGLGLIVVLVVVVLFVMQQLRHASAIQDCVASGRTNCAPIGGG
jgi:cell division septal protein FtsQ